AANQPPSKNARNDVCRGALRAPNLIRPAVIDRRCSSIRDNAAKGLVMDDSGCYAWCVKATPGTLQEGGASFATTHWSVVARCALTDVPEAANALARLCETYWPPIYSFIRRRGYSPADAQDLTQSFFALFLRTKAYARSDSLHGKFRSFLLASVKNFLA